MSALDKAHRTNIGHPEVSTPESLQAQAERTIERFEGFLTALITEDLREQLISRAYDMLSIVVFRRRERAEAAYEKLVAPDSAYNKAVTHARETGDFTAPIKQAVEDVRKENQALVYEDSRDALRIADEIIKAVVEAADPSQPIFKKPDYRHQVFVAVCYEHYQKPDAITREKEAFLNDGLFEDVADEIAAAQPEKSIEQIIKAFPGIERDLKDVREWMKGDTSFSFEVANQYRFREVARRLHSTYPDFPKDKARCDAIVKKLKAGEPAWPIFVDEEGFIMEGRHRVVAFDILNLREIPVFKVTPANKPENDQKVAP